MTVPKTKGLSRREQLLLRVVDHVASDAEHQELQQLAAGETQGDATGLDAELRQLAELRVVLGQALRPALVPDLADNVMLLLDLGQGVGPELRVALKPDRVPQLADDVLTALAAHGLEETPTARDTTTALRAALACGPTPELADDVLSSLRLDAGGLGDRLRATLDAGAEPELATQAMLAAGLPDDDVGALLRHSLASDETPDLADDIMATLGLDSDVGIGDGLRDAFSAQAPDLTGDVMSALGIDFSADAPDAAPELHEAPAAQVVPLRPARAPVPVIRRSPQATRAVTSDNVVRGTTWRFPAVAVAAAAAMLMFFVGAPMGSGTDQVAFQLSPINHVDIEELSAGDEVMVQVLQLDENAPTIIFIDEMDEADGGMPL